MFENHLPTQLALLRELRSLALDLGQPASLLSPCGHPLAVCSENGQVRLLVPIALAHGLLEGTVFRTAAATFYVGPREAIFEIERNGHARMNISKECPEIVETLADATCSPAICALAQAIETNHGLAWPAGFYRYGQTLFFTSGRGRLHRWNPDCDRLEPIAVAPLRAKRLSLSERRALPLGVQSAAIALLGEHQTPSSVP